MHPHHTMHSNHTHFTFLSGPSHPCAPPIHQVQFVLPVYSMQRDQTTGGQLHKDQSPFTSPHQKPHFSIFITGLKILINGFLSRLFLLLGGQVWGWGEVVAEAFHFSSSTITTWTSCFHDAHGRVYTSVFESFKARHEKYTCNFKV